MTVLVFLISGIHPRKDVPAVRLALFCLFLALGLAMIHVSREDTYYAVMVSLLEEGFFMGRNGRLESERY